MINTQVADNYNELLAETLKYLVQGEVVGNTKEMILARLVLTQPQNIYCTLWERKHNVTTTMAEVVWVMAGSDKMSWLTQYLPRAIDWSDDGKTWGGGYGVRLRAHKGIDRNNNEVTVDSFKQVYETLKSNKNSRQAAINIWDNCKEQIAIQDKSKDITCNNMLNFIIRDNKLHISVALRSNDLMWGHMINQSEWSIMMQLLASMLGIGVGTYVHNVMSLHMYEHHYDRAHKIIKEFDNCEEVDLTYEDDRKNYFENISNLEDPFIFVDNLLNLLYELGSPDFGTQDEQYGTNIVNERLSELVEYYTIAPKMVMTLSCFLLRSTNEHILEIVNSMNWGEVHPDLYENLKYKGYINE